eukprot:scaffold31794_cov107-Isochrysis_galbana.AAC.9
MSGEQQCRHPNLLGQAVAEELVTRQDIVEHHVTLSDEGREQARGQQVGRRALAKEGAAATGGGWA